MNASLPPASTSGVTSLDAMDALGLVRLRPLMARTEGSRDVVVGLVDGPVATELEGLASDRIRSLSGAPAAECRVPSSAACVHGTFVAAILSSMRTTPAPAICPGCTLLVRPVLREAPSPTEAPSTTPEELAAALTECVAQGARIVNLSLGVLRSSARGDRALEEALDSAARRGALVVAAAGNQGMVGSSALTRHPWVIPVAACDSRGALLPLSNFGPSIGRRGLVAPGSGVTSLLPGNTTWRGGGTSVAAPFVTGALALLWSLFPRAAAHELKQAILQVHEGRRPGIVPPRLDAERALAFIQRARTR